MTERKRDRDDFPPEPETARELIEFWVERDRRYRLFRPKGITDAQLPVVIDTRRREIDRLELPERAAAHRILSLWRPPMAHSQEA